MKPPSDLLAPPDALLESEVDTSVAMENPTVGIDQTAGDFTYDVKYAYDAGSGLSEDTIRYISDVKKEASWILDFRLKAYQTFLSKPMPTHWATKDLENIDFNKIRYYLSQGTKPKRTWDEVPDDIKKTFERLGIPEQERKFLAGVEAQFDSEAAYSNVKDIVAKQGVIFCNSTEALREHPELFRKWFGKVIPTGDNKFSALNSAVFSGGSFIYVPKGVKVAMPLQAYFRINAENFGQFERTLIIADEGAEVTYMEGCTAPKFSTSTLHSAVVELVALKGAKIQYITVQNWANNVFNLVTKRAIAMEDAEVKWIDCNIGSRLTMKYPGVILKGKRARGEVISIALANDGQHQDTGAKMVHAADDTTSVIVAKSISVGQGRSTYRGVVHIPKHLKGCKNNTECDALLINSNSRTDTYPAIVVRGDTHAVQHEASVSKISEDMIFYMQQRGLTEAQAMSLAVNGFVNDLVRQFPMEYSVELKRLIDLEMEGSVG
jgi:Fe-S cluster assembly protein SufB